MKLSLFSVSYAGYWGQETLDVSQFIAKTAELGYQGVMIAGKRPHLSLNLLRQGIKLLVRAPTEGWSTLTLSPA